MLLDRPGQPWLGAGEASQGPTAGGDRERRLRRDRRAPARPAAHARETARGGAELRSRERTQRRPLRCRAPAAFLCSAGAAGAPPGTQPRAGTGLALCPGMTKNRFAALFSRSVWRLAVASAPVARAGERRAALRTLQSAARPRRRQRRPALPRPAHARAAAQRRRAAGRPGRLHRSGARARRALARARALHRVRRLRRSRDRARRPALRVPLRPQRREPERGARAAGLGARTTRGPTRETLDKSFRAAQDEARTEQRALWTLQSFSADAQQP